MFFKPKWARILRKYFEIDDNRIKLLEDLRVKYGIMHEALLMRILSSNETTKKVQINSYYAHKKQYPEASHIELLKMVLNSRLHSQPIYKKVTINEVEFAIGNMNTINDLCNFIIAWDERETEDDPYGLGKLVDNILEGW